MVDVVVKQNEWAEHWWPAPAKLNLMLNVVGQRTDGYHELQTVFQLIAMSDWLNIVPTGTADVSLSCSLANIQMKDNLVVKAAELLKQHSGTKSGARITLKKILPMGAGLGGGSSDAATTLVVLNEVWKLGYSVAQLAAIGLSLIHI